MKEPSGRTSMSRTSESEEQWQISTMHVATTIASIASGYFDRSNRVAKWKFQSPRIANSPWALTTIKYNYQMHQLTTVVRSLIGSSLTLHFVAKCAYIQKAVAESWRVPTEFTRGSAQNVGMVFCSICDGLGEPWEVLYPK